jgi:anti-anti-sigma regulatory factor
LSRRTSTRGWNPEIFCSTLLGLDPIQTASARKNVFYRKKEQGMGIKNISEDVIFVELPIEGPRRTEELKAVNEIVSNKSDRDVIIDFSGVEVMNSWNISNLLILRSLLEGSGHQLILCNVGTVTRCIFVVAGLSEVFTFVEDKSTALAAVKNTSSSPSTHCQ